ISSALGSPPLCNHLAIQRLRRDNCRMRAMAWVLSLAVAGLLFAQDKIYVCPMDPDVRSNAEGKCSRCGMKLVAGLPDPVEYHLDLTVTPRAPKLNQMSRLELAVHDPWKDRPVQNFQVVHEKLFHLFVISRDLEFFVHDHPTGPENGRFFYDLVF